MKMLYALKGQPRELRQFLNMLGADGSIRPGVNNSTLLGEAETRPKSLDPAGWMPMQRTWVEGGVFVEQLLEKRDGVGGLARGRLAGAAQGTPCRSVAGEIAVELAGAPEIAENGAP